jgi:hypothetical protein
MGLSKPGGNEIGLISFGGAFTQSSSGVVEMNVNGTDLDQSDFVHIAGTATLSGTIRAVLGGGFTPTAGQEILLLDYASRTGTFAVSEVVNAPARPHRTFHSGPTTLNLVFAVSGVVFWDGEGDGLHWTDPLNWSTNIVPDSSDDVEIRAGASAW